MKFLVENSHIAYISDFFFLRKKETYMISITFLL